MSFAASLFKWVIWVIDFSSHSGVLILYVGALYSYPTLNISYKLAGQALATCIRAFI